MALTPQQIAEIKRKMLAKRSELKRSGTSIPQYNQQYSSSIGYNSNEAPRSLNNILNNRQYEIANSDPRAAADIYRSNLNNIDERQIATGVREDYQPGVDAITGAYREGRDVAEKGARTAVGLAEQGYSDASQLANDQRAATERNRGLASNRVGTVFNELISQTNLEKTDAERALTRRRAESKLAQDEARTIMEQRLPDALKRTKGFLAERGLLGSTATSRELSKIETQQLADLNYLERQGAIDMQDISAKEAELTQRYQEKLTNYTKMKADELTGIENKALDEISLIKADQRLSQLDKNREIARIEQALAETQNKITQDIAQAEYDNDVNVRQEITQRRQEAINQAKDLSNLEIAEPQRQMDLAQSALDLELNQKYGDKERALGLAYNENVNRQLEGAITGYDPETGDPTFDNTKFQESIRQFAQNLGYNYDVLDENKRSALANELISRYNARTSRMSAQASIDKALKEEEGDTSVFFGRDTSQYSPKELADYGLQLIGEGGDPRDVYKRAIELADDDPAYLAARRIAIAF